MVTNLERRRRNRFLKNLGPSSVDCSSRSDGHILYSCCARQLFSSQLKPEINMCQSSTRQCIRNCLPVLTSSPSRSKLFSGLSTERAHLVGEIATGAALGIAVFAALTLGFSLATFGVFVPNVVLRHLPLPDSLTPPPFDAREYPPLFNLRRPPHSVARFWSQQWHR